MGRSRAGFGATAISFQEIESWQRLYGVTLNSWELDTIIEIDAAFMAKHQEQKRKEK